MKISIITATFNSERTIADTLVSVVEQSYRNVEHIIVDGGSTDRTLEIVRDLCRRPNVVISEPDRGIYDALNKGVRLATGDVVGFLHSDDFFATNSSLNEIVEGFESSSAEAVYGDLDYVAFDDPSRVVRRWRSYQCTSRDFRFGWMPPHPTLYVRREAMLRHGLFDDALGISADYDSIIRLLWVAGLPVFHVKDVLVKMRMGGISNRSIASIIRKSREDLMVLKRHGLGGFGTLVCKNVRKISQFV